MKPSVLRAASAALLLACAAPAAAADPAPSPHVLTVTGTGEVKAAPDQAELSTGVVTHARTAAAALVANSRAMNAVFDTLKRAGIADKDIRTSGFSVSPQYATDKSGEPAQRIIGYEVSNTVSVTVEELDKLGPTLDALVAAGSNQIDGPNFMIADPKPLLAKAREDAVKDATARAEAFARAAGVSLGAILSISENGMSAPEPRLRGIVAGYNAEMLKSTPVAAGQSSVSAGVAMTWEIH